MSTMTPTKRTPMPPRKIPDPTAELPNRKLLYISEVASVLAKLKGCTPKSAHNTICRRIDRGYYVAVRLTGTLMLPHSEAVRILTGDELE